MEAEPPTLPRSGLVRQHGERKRAVRDKARLGERATRMRVDMS